MCWSLSTKQNSCLFSFFLIFIASRDKNQKSKRRSICSGQYQRVQPHTVLSHKEYNGGYGILYIMLFANPMATRCKLDKILLFILVLSITFTCIMCIHYVVLVHNVWASMNVCGSMYIKRNWFNSVSLILINLTD